MSKSISMYVRGIFALFLLGLGMYAGAESLVANELASRGLTACGTPEQPCVLETLTVTVPRSDGQVTAADAIGEQAMQVLSAAPRAPRAHPVAIAES